MRRLLIPLCLLLCVELLGAAPVWKLSPNGGICLDAGAAPRPLHDHIEMSGQQMSAVIRWGIEADGRFSEDRSLVFPLLRTIPNNTHASLRHRISTDIPALLSIDGKPLRGETVVRMEINGCIRVESIYPDSVAISRTIFPSVDKPLLGEVYTLVNRSGRAVEVHIPKYSKVFRTDPEKSLDGPFIIREEITGSGTYALRAGESLSFGAVFQAYREGGEALWAYPEMELRARMSLLDEWGSNLVLDTPDEVIDQEFAFAKIRAAESIYKTKGGFMHGPGGEAYYAAIWANDQAEYVNPFFPFLGYGIGNASALNSFRHFARYMNDSWAPIPSSIIAEGTDIWNGAGDRGDAAMIAYGAARYALAQGDKDQALELWPLIGWCLEYCERQLNEAGVVRSDCDELEGRFPAGDANLCTSCLYYDALLSTAMLARSLGKGAMVEKEYLAKAEKLSQAIESYFGADIQGFRSYRYYAGNDLLRSWICMPLIVGLKGREEGTIAALTSPLLLTEDGVLTEQGSSTFWDRSTLYTLRGIYMAGDIATASRLMHSYSERRLLGAHVPYPIEAWPEGSQRHLSAESGLYCRAVIEGMFGLRPKGFYSFSLTPRLAADWDSMILRHIRAFGGDFDIEVFRIKGGVSVNVWDNINKDSRSYKAKEGESIDITLRVHIARKKVYLEDYMDGSSDEDAMPAIRAALRECASSRASTLVLPCDTLHIKPGLAFEEYQYISNHDPSMKRIAFQLKSMKDFCIEGNGAVLMFSGHISPFHLEKCRNISVRDLTIDFDRPFVSEGKIVGAGKGFFELEFPENFGARLVQGQLRFLTPDWEEYPYSNLLEFDSARREVAYHAHDYWLSADCYPAEQTGPGRFIIRREDFGDAIVGNTLVFGAAYRHHPGFFIDNCEGVTLTDIKLHNCCGMGVIAQSTKDIDLLRVNVEPAPGSGRIISISADATHFINCKGYIRMKDCIFRNQKDDATNIHGWYMAVEKLLPGNGALLRWRNGAQVGSRFIKPGMEMELAEKSTLEACGHAKVKSVKYLNSEYAEVYFCGELPDSFAPGDVVAEDGAYPDVLISGCYIGNNRARGLLIGSRGKVVIENNVFHTPGSAILFEGDGSFWYEQSGVRDVTIRNNIFDNCMYGSPSWGRAVIAVGSGIPDKEHSRYHKNIRVEGNTFRGFDQRIVNIYCVDGFIFRGNKVEFTTDGYPASGTEDQRFVEKFCDKSIVFQDN